MRLFTLTIIFALTVGCNPSAESAEETDNPTTNTAELGAANQHDKFAAAKTTFAKRYPGAAEVSWEVDANGYHEASFRMDGEKYRADFLTDGSWLETENSIKYKQLPKAVQKIIEDEYDKDEITEIERVDHAQKGEFFDVEFKQKGKNHDVEIKADGTVIGETN